MRNVIGMTLFGGLLAAIFARSPEGPVIVTEAGSVSGIAGDVMIFKGVPFARPPIGDLRWKPPVPPQHWEGARNAREFGPACMQAGNVRKSEDCLFLNIWAPSDRNQSHPVMVWSSGGSLTGGSGNIDGSALARKGVVVVSFNYRVSTFGFLAHPQLSAESPNSVSGNYGLLDAIAALRWVRDNIGQFGGDPRRVTFWGQSSGASVITSLMVSPLADGLFQQAILQSPGAMRHWTTLKDAEKQGLELGPDIAALRRLPADQIPIIQNLGGGAEFRSLFEPRVIGQTLDGHVLPAEESEAFEGTRIPAIPVIIGNNVDEGASFTQRYPVASLAAYRAYLENPKIFGAFGNEALAFYPAASAANISRAIADSFSDSQFYLGARGIARGLTARKQKIYRYLFSRKSDKGAGHDSWHGAEGPYVMGQLAGAAYNQSDFDLSNSMMDAWVRFAATGNPNGGAIKDWPQYDLQSEPYLVFDSQVSVGHGLRNKQTDFIERVHQATGKRK